MEDFVNFEVAKKLKEKGFIGNGNIGCCYGFYCEEGFDINIVYDDLDNSELSCNEYLRPSISQVLKWLREEKNVICLPHIDPFEEKWFFYVVILPQASDFPEFMSSIIYNTYEEAALAGIEYVLDNLI